MRKKIKIYTAVKAALNIIHRQIENYKNIKTSSPFQTNQNVIYIVNKSNSINKAIQISLLDSSTLCT